MIAPAQVPKVGLLCTNSSSFRKHRSSSSLRKVVDSPPGITRPSISSNCSGLRTSTTSAPSSSRRRRCASKSPCSARTPMFIRTLFAVRYSLFAYRQTTNPTFIFDAALGGKTRRQAASLLPITMRRAKGEWRMANGEQRRAASLPSPRLQQIPLRDGADGQALHFAGHLLADLGQHLGIVVVGGGDHDGTRARFSLFALRF